MSSFTCIISSDFLLHRRIETNSFRVDFRRFTLHYQFPNALIDACQFSGKLVCVSAVDQFHRPKATTR